MGHPSLEYLELNPILARDLGAFASRLPDLLPTSLIHLHLEFDKDFPSIFSPDSQPSWVLIDGALSGPNSSRLKYVWVWTSPHPDNPWNFDLCKICTTFRAMLPKSFKKGILWWIGYDLGNGKGHGKSLRLDTLLR